MRSQRKQCEKFSNIFEQPCDGVQFEHELGPLSEEETKVSRKFVKFIMEFAIKECLDNTPTTCLKGSW